MAKTKTIQTYKGTAKYVKTETEDKAGRWNDRYKTKDGFFVKHEGKKHYVYKVNGDN